MGGEKRDGRGGGGGLDDERKVSRLCIVRVDLVEGEMLMSFKRGGVGVMF